MDDHGRLRISSSGFESWPGCHLVVAQWTRALPSEGRGHWFESSRRGHAAIAQLEERSLGTAKVPGSDPGGGSRTGWLFDLPPWRDWTRSGLLSRRKLVRIEPGALSTECRAEPTHLEG
jgi:hypothetical protein